LFGIAVARENPAAHIVALDWEPVLEVARENAVAAGVADRQTLRPGDALQVDLGGPYQLVLVTNFLHHFSRETNVALLRRLAGVLDPDGLVLTLEFIPNADRISPPMPAEFALTMLGTTAEGDAYTFDEYTEMFEEAGFRQNEWVDVPASTQRLIISGR
jgi:methylase of polypeptide subunit release factors